MPGGILILAFPLLSAVDGVVLAGCIHAPALVETFTAVKGQGAFLNGNRIRTSSPVSLARAVVSTSPPGDWMPMPKPYSRGTLPLLDLSRRKPVPPAAALKPRLRTLPPTYAEAKSSSQRPRSIMNFESVFNWPSDLKLQSPFGRFASRPRRRATHDGRGLPACSLTMYAAYHVGQSSSCLPMRLSCSP